MFYKIEFICYAQHERPQSWHIPLDHESWHIPLDRYHPVRKAFHYSRGKSRSTGDLSSQSELPKERNKKSTSILLNPLRRIWSSLPNLRKLTTRRKDKPQSSVSGYKIVPIDPFAEDIELRRIAKRIVEIKQEISDIHEIVDDRKLIPKELSDELDNWMIKLNVIMDENQNHSIVEQCWSCQNELRELNNKTCVFLSARDTYKEDINILLSEMKNEELSDIQKELVIEAILNINLLTNEERRFAIMQFENDVEQGELSFDDYVERLNAFRIADQQQSSLTMTSF